MHAELVGIVDGSGEATRSLADSGMTIDTIQITLESLIQGQSVMLATNGLMAVRWLQDKPMANYLVALVAGRLKSVEAMHRDIPMHWWTPATEIEYAMSSFTNTKPIIQISEIAL